MAQQEKPQKQEQTTHQKYYDTEQEQQNKSSANLKEKPDSSTVDENEIRSPIRNSAQQYDARVNSIVRDSSNHCNNTGGGVDVKLENAENAVKESGRSAEKNSSKFKTRCRARDTQIVSSKNPEFHPPSIITTTTSSVNSSPYRSSANSNNNNINKVNNIVNYQGDAKYEDNLLYSSDYHDKNESQKETDLLLGRNSRGGLMSSLKLPQNSAIKSATTPDNEKPSLHVQFNSESLNSNESIDAKAPQSPTASVTSNNSKDSGDSCSESSSESSSSSSSSDSLEISEARPPDGGWGWVVVAASFVVNLIADGITFSFGVIFVEFLKYFGQNRGKTAWIGSLFMAMPLLSGPVASFLTDRYGCRTVTMVGSVMASGGFVISSMANSMEVLFITFGIFAGFGLSLCYVASVVIVAYYFDKKRSFATGLSVCGSGIGTFIFAPLMQQLLNTYGWRGTTLILAGLFLNLAVCGALMRDLPWSPSSIKSKERKRKREKKNKKKSGASSADTFSVSNSTNTASVLQPILEGNEKEFEDEHLDLNRLCSSLVNLPTYVRNNEKVPIEVIELLSTHKNFYNVLLQNYPNLLTPSRSFSDSGRLHEVHLQKNHVISPLAREDINASPPNSTMTTTHIRNVLNSANATTTTTSDAAFLWWLKRNEIMPPRMSAVKKLPPAYLKDLRVHRLSLTYRGAMLNINRYRLRASSCPDIYRNSMTTIAKEKHDWYAGLVDLKHLLVDMFDFSYFCDVKYLIFAISNFLLYTWYDVPYVYLSDNAIRVGLTENDGSMLIGIIGIVNMFGEVILGWAGDRPWINPSIVYALCMGFCGAATAMLPLLTSYWTLAAASGAFGLFIAANYSLTCIILVELITLERFTNAYGLLLLVQGVANLIGPPLGGWLYDITGKYDLSFYLAGLFIAMSGLLLVILPVTKRCRRMQTLQKQQSKADFNSFLSSCVADQAVDEKQQTTIAGNGNRV